MTPAKPVLIPYEGPGVPWFVDPECRRFFSGHDYNMACVAVIGPSDFSRVLLKATTNPRQTCWWEQRKHDQPLIVHEAFWSPGNTSRKVMKELVILLERARVVVEDGWATIPHRLIGPLLLRSAEKIGVDGMSHADFQKMALQIETAKLRANLARAGLEPEIVLAHKYI